MLTHETTVTSFCLAFIGGYLDAFTYITKGGVFSNAQTGNIVLFGIGLANMDIMYALRCATPIVAFIAGVLISELLKRKTYRLSWQKIILFMEALILIAIGFFGGGVSYFVTNAIISFVCSLQVNSFRTTKGLAYATTMCTGNLRSATENLAHFIEHRNIEALKQSIHYFSIIFVFILGASAGALLSPIIDNAAVFICSGILFLILIYDFIYKRLSAATNEK